MFCLFGVRKRCLWSCYFVNRIFTFVVIIINNIDQSGDENNDRDVVFIIDIVNK